MRDRARAGVDAGFSAARGPREIADFVGWVGARPPRTRRCKELRGRDSTGSSTSRIRGDRRPGGPSGSRLCAGNHVARTAFARGRCFRQPTAEARRSGQLAPIRWLRAAMRHRRPYLAPADAPRRTSPSQHGSSRPRQQMPFRPQGHLIRPRTVFATQRLASNRPPCGPSRVPTWTRRREALPSTRPDGRHGRLATRPAPGAGFQFPRTNTFSAQLMSTELVAKMVSRRHCREVRRGDHVRPVTRPAPSPPIPSTVPAKSAGPSG